MKTGKPVVAVYNTKSYDREYLSRAMEADELQWYFHDFRLEPETALSADDVSFRRDLVATTSWPSAQISECAGDCLSGVFQPSSTQRNCTGNRRKCKTVDRYSKLC